MIPSAEADNETTGYFSVVCLLPYFIMTTFGARTGFKFTSEEEEEDDV